MGRYGEIDNETLEDTFFREQYDELQDLTILGGEETVWNTLSAAEQYVIESRHPELTEQIKAYADIATDTVSASDYSIEDWSGRHSSEIADTFSYKWFNEGDETELPWFFNTGISGKQISFHNYLQKYEDSITNASTSDELETYMEAADVDHWTAKMGRKQDDWYSELWEALQIGSPCGHAILCGDTGNTEVVEMHAAELIGSIEDILQPDLDSSEPHLPDFAS